MPEIKLANPHSNKEVAVYKSVRAGVNHPAIWCETNPALCVDARENGLAIGIGRTIGVTSAFIGGPDACFRVFECFAAAQRTVKSGCLLNRRGSGATVAAVITDGLLAVLFILLGVFGRFVSLIRWSSWSHSASGFHLAAWLACQALCRQPVVQWRWSCLLSEFANFLGTL
ncbi:hypothetical protein ACA910_001912 [Epithemia clementina (nom. ined.)]